MVYHYRTGSKLVVAGQAGKTSDPRPAQAGHIRSGSPPPAGQYTRHPDTRAASSVLVFFRPHRRPAASNPRHTHTRTGSSLRAHVHPPTDWCRLL